MSGLFLVAQDLYRCLENSNALCQSRMSCHTQAMVQKIAVTLDRRTVADLDRWVREGRYRTAAGASIGRELIE